MSAFARTPEEWRAWSQNPDEYAAENVFWVPKEARWSSIGKLIDEAMIAMEKRNESLKGVLPKDYARPALNALPTISSASSKIEVLRCCTNYISGATTW